MEDKDKRIPVIIKKELKKTGPLEVNVRRRDEEHYTIREEHISFDKIVEDSKSEFVITGKTTKIGLMNFLNLVEKHDILELDNLDKEELILGSELITRIATATVIDEIQEDLKYVDSFAIGIFLASFLLSLFALFTSGLADIKTFSWILLLISGAFLGHYIYRGVKSGELNRITRVVITSLSKK